MSAPLLTSGDVLARLRVSRPTLWAWRRAGKFPKPVVLPGGGLRWAESTLDRWLASRVAR